MADAATFDAAATLLEERSTLDRLEARGTLRIALKSSGFDARSVTPEQLRVVIERVLPGELTARGVPDAERTSQELARSITIHAAAASTSESPEAIFARIGRSTERDKR